MELAILSIPTLKLTRLQKWIIRSSAPTFFLKNMPAKRSLFNYKENSNLIANLIKKLFSPAF